MSSSPATERTFIQSSCTARDPRVAEAVESIGREAFKPLQSSLRPLPTDALVRMLEDLQVTADSRVLVVEPFSGRLPAALGRLAQDVTVVCSNAERANDLRVQLIDEKIENVQVSTFLQDRDSDDDRGFDRIVVMQPANEELGPVLLGQLAAHGRAVWSVDRASPPRRVRRLLRLDDTSTLEEDLDLVHYMPLLGDMLVEAGVVLRQEVAEAVQMASENGRRLGEELLARGSVREQDLYGVLGEQRKMNYVVAAELLPRIDLDLVNQLPRKYLNYYQFLPVSSHDGEVVVVTSDVDLAVKDLSAVFDDATVVAELITPSDLQRVWAAVDLGLAGAGAPGHSTASSASMPASSPVDDSVAAKLFDDILDDALGRGATDVHFESRSGGVRLRFRIDGALQDDDRHAVRKEDLAAILQLTSRMSSRNARAASISWQCGENNIDLLVSQQPTVHGVGAVVRLSTSHQSPPALDELGFDESMSAAFADELQKPRGTVLFCGPMRSGRTTTMYACLRQLVHDSSRKVVAIEEAPSFALTGIQQVVATAGETAECVRENGRQAADVLMVGELGDAETIAETMRAARSGHLVLAAMSANDSIDALQELCDSGATNNTLASTVNAVFVQVLARKNCSHCCEPKELSDEQRSELFPTSVPQGFTSHAGKGCSQCRGSGFDGLVPVVEYLPLTPTLRRALRRGVAPHDLGAVANEPGMRTMRASAMALVQNGTISVTEMRTVLTSEQLQLSESCGSPAGRCS